MKVLCTLDDRSANVPEFPYTILCDEDGTEIRIHHIDEGPRDAEPILLKNPGAPLNREAWARLASFDKPFLTLFGELEPVARGWEKSAQEYVKGAEGQDHRIIASAGTLSRRMRRLSWSSASRAFCR